MSTKPPSKQGRPKPDAALVAQLSDACRSYHAAVDSLDEAVCTLEGINRTDLRCLDVLERVDRMTAGHLADACGVTTGAMTALLDRLERLGYVARDRDPDDRRKVYVAVTDVVRAKAAELYGPLEAAHAELAESFTTNEIRLILRYLEAGRQINLDRAVHLRALTAQVRPAEPPAQPPSAA